uniref:Uncharacterized protein n=1 Tax=Oryza sativa subsp. indica TaxID=39946 RepID=A0A679BCH4_ORYSI|nr:hypothetical protein [Oryza sativa Indica Group]BBD82354.1 hypothetical protein [Oryza sativa Indica Group]BBD82365.1 hypothetical protein [Oryza sativa Indica Group]
MDNEEEERKVTTEQAGSEFAREDSPDTPERGSWCVQPRHLGSREEEDEQVQFPGASKTTHAVPFLDTGGGVAALRHGSAWEHEEEMLVRGGDNQVAAVNYFRYTDMFYIGPICSDSSSTGRHVEWLRSMISFFAWFLVYAVETFVLCHCSLLVTQ